MNKTVKWILAFLILTISTSCMAFSWECVNRTMLVCDTWRMYVPGGWLVEASNPDVGGSHAFAMVYYPDPKHEWNG